MCLVNIDKETFTFVFYLFVPSLQKKYIHTVWKYSQDFFNFLMSQQSHHLAPSPTHLDPPCHPCKIWIVIVHLKLAIFSIISQGQSPNQRRGSLHPFWLAGWLTGQLLELLRYGKPCWSDFYYDVVMFSGSASTYLDLQRCSLICSFKVFFPQAQTNIMLSSCLHLISIVILTKHTADWWGRERET